MNSFESPKNSTEEERVSREQRLEKQKEIAEKLEEDILKAEVERLRNPQISAYDNLKRFGKRSVTTGLVLAALLTSGSPSLLPTYRPYVETGSVQENVISIESLESYEHKTPEIEKKIKEARLAVDEILSQIGRAEKLHLAKLDVDILMDLSGRLSNRNVSLDARCSQRSFLLQVVITEDFDTEEDSKALEALLAHEVGHLIDEQTEQGITNKEIEAFHSTRLANPEIDSKLVDLESKKRTLERKKAPEVFEIKKEIKKLRKKLATQSLTAKEGQDTRDLIKKLEEKEEDVLFDLREKDRNYLEIIREIYDLEEELIDKMLPYLIKDGGPEVIADFFQARWAVKRGWSEKELTKAAESIIGKLGPSSSDLYGPTIQYRHRLIKFFYNQIQKNPKKYLKHMNDRKTIHSCVANMYKEFISQDDDTSD